MTTFMLQVGKVLDPNDPRPIYLRIDGIEGLTTLEEAENYARNLARFVAEVFDVCDEWRALKNAAPTPDGELQ